MSSDPQHTYWVCPKCGKQAGPERCEHCVESGTPSERAMACAELLDSLVGQITSVRNQPATQFFEAVNEARALLRELPAVLDAERQAGREEEREDLIAWLPSFGVRNHDLPPSWGHFWLPELIDQLHDVPHDGAAEAQGEVAR